MIAPVMTVCCYIDATFFKGLFCKKSCLNPGSTYSTLIENDHLGDQGPEKE